MIVGWGSSSMERIGPAMDCVLNGSGRWFHNLGRGGESSHHTAARIGALPPRLSFPENAVPAAGSVPVESVLTHRGVALKPFAVAVAGVQGVLSHEDGVILFTREAPGAAVPLDGPVPARSLRGPELASFDSLLWIGKNDLSDGADAAGVIERTDATADWLTSHGARVLVLGHFVNTDAPAGQQHQVEIVNRAHDSRYGSHFLDINTPLRSADIWSAIGLEATEPDRREQTAGRKPISISADAAHLDMVGYSFVASLVRDRLADLGWL